MYCLFADGSRSVKNIEAHLSTSETDTPSILASVSLCHWTETVPSLLTEILFRDIGGYEEVKIEIVEFVNFFNQRELYTKLGARPLKVLIYVYKFHLHPYSSNDFVSGSSAIRRTRKR